MSLITTSAAAPSFSGQQLPAVTVPSFAKHRLELPRPSRVSYRAAVRRRVATTVPSGVVTGRISRSKNPLAIERLRAILAQDGELVLIVAADVSEDATFSAVWPIAMKTSGT